MPSGATLEQKKAIVLESLLPMLRNDLHKVVDSTCRDHGVPGPGPNFTAAMLCMVACEAMGRLSSDPSLDDDAATLEFLNMVARRSGDIRYEQAAKAIIVYFRHGIVHSFMPKWPDSVRAAVSWAQEAGGKDIGVCVDWLSSPPGAADLAKFRALHLIVRQVFGERVFTLIPQVLYVDILGTVIAFEQALKQDDSTTLARLDEGFEKWWGRVSSIKGQLDDAGKRYLGIRS